MSNVALPGISARIAPYWPEGLLVGGEYGVTGLICLAIRH